MANVEVDPRAEMQAQFGAEIGKISELLSEGAFRQLSSDEAGQVRGAIKEVLASFGIDGADIVDNTDQPQVALERGITSLPTLVEYQAPILFAQESGGERLSGALSQLKEISNTLEAGILRNMRSEQAELNIPLPTRERPADDLTPRDIARLVQSPQVLNEEILSQLVSKLYPEGGRNLSLSPISDAEAEQYVETRAALLAAAEFLKDQESFDKVVAGISQDLRELSFSPNGMAMIETLLKTAVA